MISLWTPVLLLLLGGGLLALQINRMMEDADWLEHSQVVIATTYDVQRQIIDQETSLRGYLLTEADLVLEAFHAARPREAIERLRALVGDSAEQTASVEALLRSYERWLQIASAILAPAADLERLGALEELERRKSRMDTIRVVLGEIIDRETELRATRSAASVASVRSTRIAVLSVFVVLAGALAFLTRTQLVAIARTYGDALAGEQAIRAKVEDQDWSAAGVIELGEAMQGELDVDEVVTRALHSVAKRTGAEVGAAFASSATGWSLRAGHGFAPQGTLEFARGDGLVGRSANAAAVMWLSDLPHDYLRVRSGLGETGPREVVALPAVADGRVVAALELGFLHEVPERVRQFLQRVSEPFGAAVRSAEYRERLRSLLEQEQKQSEELQAQQEELRVANEELEQQGEELRGAHTQLEERQQALEEANAGLEAQTLELRRAEREITAKAEELGQASRYKSEFLANMSHELRTPLNSTLILAKLLADNEPGTLSDEQVRFAQTIYQAGNDLLALINDILDLSKIEAGRMEVRPSQTNVVALLDPVMRTFDPLATDKGLRLRIDYGEAREVPLVTDVQRVQQIVKNLLSNAVKFTDLGQVTVSTAVVDDRLVITVTDTGIGFAPEQGELIFEAFRQADGTTRRKHGGTGLGLAISRDFARLLGGDVTAESAPGRGSVFRMFIPLTHVGRTETALASPVARPLRPAAARSPATPTSSNGQHRDARHLLIIEDDVAFAGILDGLARELGYESAIAGTAALGLELAETLLPRAILLDVRLPDHSGLGVLDALKHHPATRHIPVHMISAVDHSEQALAMGAAGYITKPVSRDDLVSAVRKLETFAPARRRRLLVVEDDATQREAVTKLLEGPDLEILAVGTAGEALAALREATFDCMVTDLGLPDVPGADLLQTIADDQTLAFPPVIVYTGRELDEAEEARLRALSPSIVVKGARSPERLLDEVTLFLHRVESQLPPERQHMLRRARDQEDSLVGRKVLIVEDDVRNVFALTSALEAKGLRVLIARNGREAIETLEREPVALVLMDVMMPEMDGIEAMQRIRANRRFAKLPIIALTAKAMPDDRERCLTAGANDYIAKPLHVDRLLSLIRVWIQPGAIT